MNASELKLFNEVFSLDASKVGAPRLRIAAMTVGTRAKASIVALALSRKT
jgi:hypothetical protein